MQKINFDVIAHELLEMSQVDQEMRIKSIKDRSLWDDSIDQHNTARLKEIVNEIGWLTISKVGAEASHAAWLLVQHAYAELDFMKSCLALMKKANEQKEGDVKPANVAFLEDRLLTMEDKPQIYGTQFRTIDGVTEPFPMENPAHVDERRAIVGLDTFAENEARIRAMYG